MSQKTIILTVILFALIVIGMFLYARIRHSELSYIAPYTSAKPQLSMQ